MFERDLGLQNCEPGDFQSILNLSQQNFLEEDWVENHHKPAQASPVSQSIFELIPSFEGLENHSLKWIKWNSGEICQNDERSSITAWAMSVLRS